MRKNDIVETEIIGTATDGSGIGKVDGMVVFVPASAEGDILRVRILKVLKNRAYGKIETVLKSSSNRIEPDCPVFDKCGGCVFRHISYDAEKQIKSKRVYDAISRIGGFDVKPQPILAENRNAYRNKAQYPVSKDTDGQLIAGFYAPHSHRVIPCDHCLLQPEEFEKALNCIQNWAVQHNISVYDEDRGTGLLRHIYLRKGFATGQIMAVLVINGEELPFQNEWIQQMRNCLGDALKSLQININTKRTNVVLGSSCKVLFGQEYIEDILCNLRIRISPLSFYQVNRNMSEKLYQKVAEYAEPSGKTIIDLYCGAGTIGLSMASCCKQVIGVEIVPEAVKDAEKNAALNQIENAKFICGDAAYGAKKIRDQGIQVDVIILDPPRKGCSMELLDIVANDFSPERIVYVSCDPATLARDLKILGEHGYELDEYTPVDLFPGTGHVETVCLLSKLNAEHHIEVDLALNELDLTSSESKATYEEIRKYVLDKFGFKVSQLYIAQVKRKHGIIERENYNTGDGKAKVPQVPAEKETAIEDALRHFEMI